MKTCTKCLQEKTEAEFTRNRNRPDGRSFRCRQCQDADRVRRKLEKGEPISATSEPVPSPDTKAGSIFAYLQCLPAGAEIMMVEAAKIAGCANASGLITALKPWIERGVFSVRVCTPRRRMISLGERRWPAAGLEMLRLHWGD